MALSRRKWNNVIIIASVLMITILTLLDDKTSQLPDDAHPLFDDVSSLAQLQMNELWLNRGSSNWQCHPKVLNCQAWGEAWSKIQLSPLPDQQGLIESDTASRPKELLIVIASNEQAQPWSWYEKLGLLKSPANNWYLIPPSQREALSPVIKIGTTKNSGS
ncbi:hypothetical protein [uncultured Shewanella sp.]|uniref:hypothetical protein n=1 Tax=uncultured Shewanella sp. TaxID=173975 RepID=UPI002611E841|nr:hypothetical protein [uncultured Shewanella sp.]